MEKKSATPSGFTGRQLMATILIACGVLLLGRNLGIFPNRIFHIIVSWPMLLVVGMCGNRLFLSSAVQKKRKEDTE